MPEEQPGTQLVPADIADNAVATLETFDTIISSVDYLPRLQLFSARTDACQEGKIPINHYGLVKDNQITDLDADIDIVIVAWRSKAIKIDGDNLIIDFHPDIVDDKVTNPIFKKIMEMSGVRDSGCMYGPEFLVWVPMAKTFATLHMNSKTSRREANNFKPLLGKAATLKSKLIDPPTSKFKWQGIVALPCSSPLEAPPEDDLREQYVKFTNPPRNTIETAPDDGEERAR